MGKIRKGNTAYMQPRYQDYRKCKEVGYIASSALLLNIHANIEIVAKAAVKAQSSPNSRARPSAFTCQKNQTAVIIIVNNIELRTLGGEYSRSTVIWDISPTKHWLLVYQPSWLLEAETQMIGFLKYSKIILAVF